MLVVLAGLVLGLVGEEQSLVGVACSEIREPDSAVELGPLEKEVGTVGRVCYLLRQSLVLCFGLGGVHGDVGKSLRFDTVGYLRTL